MGVCRRVIGGDGRRPPGDFFFFFSMCCEIFVDVRGRDAWRFDRTFNDGSLDGYVLRSLRCSKVLLQR